MWSLLAQNASGLRRSLSRNWFYLLFILFVLFIGLRFAVGADWYAYVLAVRRLVDIPISLIFHDPEPGYSLFSWLGANWGGDIYLVNVLCALVFSYCLLIFCQSQPLPWLALTLAFPYLITVVAMGYSRQGVAIGFELMALLALQRDRLLQFLGWIALASLFHRTVLVMLVLPVSTLSGSFRFSQLIRLGLLAGSAYGLYTSLIAPDLDYYMEGYISAEYQSQGALIRVILCVLPALLFLLNRRSFGLPLQEQRIWSFVSFMAVAAFIGLFTVASSTAIDRLALYLIPLQLFVGSRIPDTRLFGITPHQWNSLLIVFSLAVLSIWLLFAGHSVSWLPYRNILLPL